jgi:hypothetical protein
MTCYASADIRYAHPQDFFNVLSRFENIRLSSMNFLLTTVSKAQATGRHNLRRITQENHHQWSLNKVGNSRRPF